MFSTSRYESYFPARHSFHLLRYFFVGYQAEASKFFIFFFILTLFQLISESLGLLCSVITGQLTYAVICLTFLLLVLLSFSGFLVARIPV